MKYIYTLILGLFVALIAKVTLTTPMPEPYDDKWDAYLSTWIGHYILLIIVVVSFVVRTYKVHIKEIK